MFRFAAGTFAASMLFAGIALAEAPEAPRIPKPRPALEGETSPALAKGTAPAPLASLDPETARIPRPRPSTGPSAPASPTLGVNDKEQEACLRHLAALGATFEVLTSIDSDGQCPVDRPLKVSGLGSGVEIAPEAILNCATAESLSAWLKDVVVPEARETLHTSPTRIVHGSTYVCRSRNNAPGAKLSEHARANAVDISAIEFAGRDPVQIGGSIGMEARFEAVIRAGACKHFTTVLGPGSNAAHATHLHFDLAERRGGYRLCELGEARVVRGP
jgi:hypothetical protein